MNGLCLLTTKPTTLAFSELIDSQILKRQEYIGVINVLLTFIDTDEIPSGLSDGGKILHQVLFYPKFGSS